MFLDGGVQLYCYGVLWNNIIIKLVHRRPPEVHPCKKNNLSIYILYFQNFISTYILHISDRIFSFHRNKNNKNLPIIEKDFLKKQESIVAFFTLENNAVFEIFVITMD